MTDFSSCCVITPVYNAGKFVLPMLKSVERQYAVNVKHIIYDGGSKDGTIDTLREWAETHNNVVFVSEKDEGQADALGKALRDVDTTYFGWLNADDLYLTGGLKALLNAAERETQQTGTPPAIVYGDYVRIDDSENVVALRKQPSFCRWDCVRGYMTVQNTAAIFNTSLLKNIGGFDKRWRFVMDYDVVLRLSRVGKVVHIPKYCGAFREHPAAKTATMQEICVKETALLRTLNGVSNNELVARVGHFFAKTHVALRMAGQGCLRSRFRKRGLGDVSRFSASM